jgi:hypothetical protein
MPMRAERRAGEGERHQLGKVENLPNVREDLLDHERERVIEFDIGLEETGRKLGCLNPWETLTG